MTRILSQGYYVILPNKIRETQKNNTSGYIGVDFHKASKKWRARVKVSGKYVFNQYYYTIEEAVTARDRFIVKNKLCRKLNKGVL